MRGHIRKRARGSWTVVFDLPRDPETGRRRQKWLTVRGTKRDAERVLAEMLARLSAGGPPPAPDLALAEFLDRWYEACRTAVRPATQEFWRRALKYWKDLLGGVPLARLTPMDVQRAVGELPAHLSASTRHAYFGVLRSALGQAVKWGLLGRDPTRGVKAPPRPRREMRVWDEEQAVRFLEAARTTRYGTLFHLALATGLRMGELLALTWDDVDLEAGLIRVRRTAAPAGRGGGGPSWQEPKTPAGRRRVPIDALTVALLREHRRAQLSGQPETERERSGERLVFCTRTGRPVSPSNLHKALTACCRRAGVPRIRFHDLRHTHATLLLRQGVHPKVVSERLGHAGVRVTLDMYSHVLPDTQQEAVRAVERALGRPEVRPPRSPDTPPR